jgi:hypothetical protein
MSNSHLVSSIDQNRKLVISSSHYLDPGRGVVGYRLGVPLGLLYFRSRSSAGDNRV